MPHLGSKVIPLSGMLLEKKKKGNVLLELLTFPSRLSRREKKNYFVNALYVAFTW